MSDIRVSVQWKNPTVFAGEDIECTITFKNITQARSVCRSPSPKPSPASHSSSNRERWKETLPLRSTNPPTSALHRKSPSLSGPPKSNAKTQKQALSLNNANGFQTESSSVIDVHDETSKSTFSGDNKHRRSVSIVSIRGEAVDETSPRSQLMNSGRSGHGHTRAASLHVMPRRNGLLSNGSPSGNSHSAYVITC